MQPTKTSTDGCARQDKTCPRWPSALGGKKARQFGHQDLGRRHSCGRQTSWWVHTGALTAGAGAASWAQDSEKTPPSSCNTRPTAVRYLPDVLADTASRGWLRTTTTWSHGAVTSTDIPNWASGSSPPVRRRPSGRAGLNPKKRYLAAPDLTRDLGPEHAPRIALRADMDALPMTERTGRPTPRRFPG